MPVSVEPEQREFDDKNEISDWAADSVQAVCSMGFMEGVGDNKFAPQDTYTAEQAVATIVRVYDGTLYIPVQMAAELMGYDIAVLDAIIE